MMIMVVTMMMTVTMMMMMMTTALTHSVILPCLRGWCWWRWNCWRETPTTKNQRKAEMNAISLIFAAYLYAMIFSNLNLNQLVNDWYLTSKRAWSEHAGQSSTVEISHRSHLLTFSGWLTTTRAARATRATMVDHHQVERLQALATVKFLPIT